MYTPGVSCRTHAGRRIRCAGNSPTISVPRTSKYGERPKQTTRPAAARRPRLLIFFPLRQAARLSQAELLGHACATVAVPPGILPSLGSTPCPELDIMFAWHTVNRAQFDNSEETRKQNRERVPAVRQIKHTPRVTTDLCGSTPAASERRAGSRRRSASAGRRQPGYVNFAASEPSPCLVRVGFQTLKAKLGDHSWCPARGELAQGGYALVALVKNDKQGRWLGL